MMLYTLVPPEVIFGGDSSFAVKNDISEFKKISYAGKEVLVSNLPDGQGFKIERLLSTEPADYLNPLYQPGRVIKSYE